MKKRKPYIGAFEIRRMRQALGVTKEEFAKLLRVTSGATIASWERRGSMKEENHTMLVGIYEQLRPLIELQDKLLKSLCPTTPKAKASVTDFASKKFRMQSERRTFMAG
jgi:transcriptional regulator with XRE-family HTH domain